MGGVTLLFAGGIRRTIPVVPTGNIGTRADEVLPCLKHSSLKLHIEKLSLKTNMRVHHRGEQKAGEFAKMLLDICESRLNDQNVMDISGGLCNLVRKHC